MAQSDIIVLMPAYNAAKYIREAIDSVLGQTRTDFVLAICDDCSTDDTAAIIQSYTDSRIQFVQHPVNMGVVAAMKTLTSCIQVEHRYAAIMHADDICHPERLEKQYRYLEEHEDVAVLATLTQHINEAGIPEGSWPLDEATLTARQIRQTMPRENCITHSSVMIRSIILEAIGYDSHQARSTSYAVEDYPLWLNVLSSGYSIEKLNERLLYYRVHHNNTTNREYRTRNAYQILYETKKKYLETRKKTYPLNDYDRLIAFYMRLDYLKSIGKNIKSSYTSGIRHFFKK